MATSDQMGLANKTDEEIQAELDAVKKKFYERMDTQLEKDLILEEREKLASEKRNLDVQIKFLKQKMKKVYQDELDIREYLEPDVNSSHQTGNDPREKEKLFFDITKNGPPVTPPKSQETDLNIVPPRKSRSHLI